MRYERILAAVAASPWAIEPNKGRVIAAFLARKARGETIPAVEIQAVKAAKAGGSARPPKNVGMIPIYGTITQRADLMTDYSGGTSCEDIGAQLDQFVNDPRIDVIVLDVDSPGGSVFGVQELAAKILAARDQKKIIGVANALAASAGYWLLSQASEVVVTPSGQVGSIGVYQMHVDESKALEMAGETVTLVSAGELKTVGNPYGPLGDAGLKSYQTFVDGYYDSFVKAVGAGRGVPPSAVRAGFGKGDVVAAKDAVAQGMADKVATMDETLARFGVSRSGAATTLAARADTEIRRRRMLLDG